MPIALTDDELDAVFRAARPLRVRDRDLFLQEVANELAVAGEVGPGTVNRAVRAAQKKFFDPPELSARRRQQVSLSVAAVRSAAAGQCDQ